MNNISRDLSKYTYERFLREGNIIEEYYDGKTRVVISNNSIMGITGKRKKIIINIKTRQVRIEF